MNSDREIADAVKTAQRLLWHTYDLPAAVKVERLRTFVRSPTVQSALQRSSDTLLAFTLRAVELAIADQSRTDREMVRRLWHILLNNPHLIQAMWPQNSPFGPSWLSVRPAPGCASHGDFGGSGRCRHTAHPRPACPL
jgi:hypothetical protein